MITALFILAFGLSVSRGLRKNSIQKFMSQNQQSAIEMVIPVKQPVASLNGRTIHLLDYISESKNPNKSNQRIRLQHKELAEIHIILN